MNRLSSWMNGNLATQGYCLTGDEAHTLRVGLRFTTAACLPLVAFGIALESPAVLLALAGVAFAGGFMPRHPFDLVWNHGVRHLARAPELPPNPRRRRHAFKFGAASLATVALLFAAGQAAAATALGATLLAACTLVTAVNFCVPSTVLHHLETRGTRGAATT